jgi:hypothetical protein
MSDILAKLKAGRSVIKTFPLGDITLGLRILTETDYQEAGWAANALLDTHEAELTVANADLFESEKATQLIMRFVVDPTTRKPVFPSADEVRNTLSRAERNAIADKYYDFEKEYSPSERTMSEEQFAALLEDVKKKPDDQRLNDLSGALLKKLVLSLVAPPAS